MPSITVFDYVPGIDGGGTIDRRRSHANPHQTNPYSGGGPGAPPMIHYPARSCHPLSPPTSAGTNTISSSAPMPVGSSPASPQIGYHYPPPGAPHPGFQSPYGKSYNLTTHCLWFILLMRLVSSQAWYFSIQILIFILVY